MRTRHFVLSDREAMETLVVAYRAAGYAARYPTLWRVRLLLDSRVWDDQRDICLWEDDGRLTGFGLLWRRRRESDYFALERVLDPTVPEPQAAELNAAMLDWAMQRASAEASERDIRISLAVIPLELNPDRDLRLLAANGFDQISTGHNLYFAMPLGSKLVSQQLPTGFQLGPLESGDLDAYARLYGFTPVSTAHQRTLLNDPEYKHFVVKTSDGALCAYLECSLAKREWRPGQPRIGWIDYVETEASFARIGLAQALMTAGLEYLQSLGADRAMLITRHDNVPAHGLFRRSGMAVTAEEYGYSRNFGAGQD